MFVILKLNICIVFHELQDVLYLVPVLTR